MQNLYKKNATLMVLGLAVLLASCSKQISSVYTPNKLAYAQVLTSSHGSLKNPASVASPALLRPLPIAETAPPSLTYQKEQKVFVKHETLHRRLFSLASPAKLAKAVQKQANAITNPHVGNHASSYSGTMHAERFLGFAVVCLIAGLVLFFLGFHAVGALLWTIGIVVLIIALVFFLLWILGTAVAG